MGSREWGDGGDEGAEGAGEAGEAGDKENNHAQCPMPHSQFPIPYSPLPLKYNYRLDLQISEARSILAR